VILDEYPRTPGSWSWSASDGGGIGMTYGESCQDLIGDLDESGHVPHGRAEAIDDTVVQRIA